jgi:hypothetical protein
MEHELLSERRFFGEFLGLPEVPANEVLPDNRTPHAFAARMVELSRERLHFLASRGEDWWLTVVPFFDVERERIWIFWRRVLHTAHHRAQLGVYLRMLNKRCRQHTVQLPMCVGKAPIRQAVSPLPVVNDLYECATENSCSQRFFFQRWQDNTCMRFVA